MCIMISADRRYRNVSKKVLHRLFSLTIADRLMLFKHQHRATRLFALLFVWSLSWSALAQKYTITDLGAFPGSTSTHPTGINTNSVVCGYAAASFVGCEAWIWRDGVMTELGGVGTAGTVAHDINELDQVVGYDYTYEFLEICGGESSVQGLTYGRLWQNGSVIDLGELPGGIRGTFAVGINNWGQVVGGSHWTDCISMSATDSFLWQNGAMINIGNLPGSGTGWASGINDGGQVIGTSYFREDDRWNGYLWQNGGMINLGDVYPYGINNLGQVVGHGGGVGHGFLWENGIFTDIGTLGGDFSQANGINNLSQVVGYSSTTNNVVHAFIWQEGEMKDLNDLIPADSGWELSVANAISDRGEIVGTGNHDGELYRGFLLKPAIPIRVDASRDGMIDFEDKADETDEKKPYRFWLNFDHDSSGQDVETGDLDAFDTTISHVRDLEDFAQIQIQLDSSVKKKIDEGDKLAIETTGGLQINLYKAVNPSTDYLFDQSAADQQVNSTFTANGVTKNFGRALDQSDISPWIDAQEYGDNPISFILEGRAEGEGTVKIVLKRPDGTVERSGEVHVKLMKVEDMFERAHVTTARADNRFRLPWEPPYTCLDINYEPPNVGYANDTPNFQKPSDETQQLIVFVHGFNNTDFVKQNWSEMMFKRLWHQDYKGRFASMFWPTPLESEAVDVILSTEFFGFKYGSSLQGHLGELKDRLSGYTINVTAHSAGNIIVGEALKQGATIDHYVLMQAAVAASSYDPNAPVDDGLDKQENTHPTYDPAQQMDYRGYLQNVQGNLVNFYNPEDGALEKGFRLGFDKAFKKVSWKIFQLEFKPFDPEEKKVQYTYDKKLGVPILELPGKPKSRDVTNIHESMSFVARSRTKAVGAEGGTGGSIDSVVNLKATFNFGDTREEHSAQFNRNIQNVHEFYKQLGVKLGVLAP